MALSVTMMRELLPVLKPGMKIASMGYPDIISADWADAVPIHEDVALRNDSEAICARHGLPSRPIPDAHSFFRSLGASLDVFDVVAERGCEIILDLNYPLDADFDRRRLSGKAATYDIVLDVGTLEHIMNIGTAMTTMAGMVKVGGYIIHENPHSGYSNHGFYSLHPTFFNDFYTGNGFEVVKCVLATKDGASADIPPTARFRTPEGDINVFCMASRVTKVPMRWMTQSKYALKAHASIERG